MSLISESDNEKRAARRKLWHHGMGTAALRDFAPTMAKRVQQCFDMLEESANRREAVDISSLLSRLAYVALWLAFGIGDLIYS